MAAPESVEAALRDKLLRSDALSPLIGERVYPVMVPTSGTYPCLVFRRTGTIRRDYMLGASGAIAGRFTVWLWSRDYDQTKAMFAAFRLWLDGESESVTVGPNTFRLKRISIEPPGEHDDFDEAAFAEGEDIYCTVVPLQIEHTEATVTH